MPVYEYSCFDCGNSFERVLSMSEYKDPQICNSCNKVASKVILSAPMVMVSRIEPSVKKAHETNERSRHAPRHHSHDEHCQHNKADNTKQVKGFSDRRPWMISH